MTNFFHDYVLGPLQNCYRHCRGESPALDSGEVSLRALTTIRSDPDRSARPGRADDRKRLRRLIDAPLPPPRRLARTDPPSFTVLRRALPKLPSGLHLKWHPVKSMPSQAVSGEDIPLCEAETDDEPPDEQFISGTVNYRHRHTQPGPSSNTPSRESVQVNASERIQNDGDGVVKKSGPRRLVRVENGIRWRPPGGVSPPANMAFLNPAARPVDADERPGLLRKWKEWAALQDIYPFKTREEYRQEFCKLRDDIAGLDAFEQERGYQLIPPGAQSLTQALRFWFAKFALVTGLPAPAVSSKLSRDDENNLKAYLWQMVERADDRHLPLQCLTHARKIGLALDRDMVREINKSMPTQSPGRRIHEELNTALTAIEYWERLYLKAFEARFPPAFQKKVFDGVIPPPDLDNYTDLERYGEHASWKHYVEAVGTAESEADRPVGYFGPRPAHQQDEILPGAATSVSESVAVKEAVRRKGSDTGHRSALVRSRILSACCGLGGRPR